MTALAITMGEPAGIGPELCLHILNAPIDKALVVIGDYACLARRARLFDIPFSAARVDSIAAIGDNKGGRYRAVLDCCPLAKDEDIGKPAPQNAAAVLHQLHLAADGCMRGDFVAMTTAPVQKSSILAAGFAFVGQTEYLAARAKVLMPVMLLAGSRLRVALATTHLPLAKVAAAITADGIMAKLKVLNEGLTKWCNIAKPRIAVTGLNPHCGEGGLLGDEEERIIIPALRRARQSGIDATGPAAADAVFIAAAGGRYDCVLAMYHDQGLPVIKFDGADTTTNITLGLPFLRTSPAHGTALDIAAAGKARTAGMLAAVSVAAAVV